MAPIMFGLLLVTVAVGSAAAACDQCNFTADSFLVQTGCTTVGNLRLSCGGANLITHGENSFDNIVCVYDEWYGMSCDGKVSVLGASVDVSCPFTCETTCSSDSVSAIEHASTVSCYDGKEMRTCESGDLSVETDSGTVSFSKAVCLPGDKWLAFNCDGTAKIIAGSLKARCTPAVACPTLTEITPAQLAASKPDAVYEKALITEAGASCGSPTGVFTVIIQGTIVPMDKIKLECANGDWEFVDAKGGRGKLSETGQSTTSVCCILPPDASTPCPPLTELSQPDMNGPYPKLTYEKATITATSVTCPSGSKALLAFKGFDGLLRSAVAGSTMACNAGHWEIVDSQQTRKLMDVAGVETTQVCCGTV